MANQLKEELVLSTSKFDSNINSVIKKVEELKNKGSKVGSGFDSSMSKMIEKATGFNGSLGSLIGVLGKFGGALGLAMGAGEAFNKVIHSSQTLTDEFGATQQGVTTVVDNFFQSLANGDFSPFLNGMDNMVSKAREAFNAMDDLWNMAQSFSVQNARLNNQFQQNLNEIRAKKDSKDPNDKKRVKELTEENKRIIEQQAKGGVKLYNQTISGLQSEIAAGTGMNSKITEGAIYRIVENDINNLKDGRARYEKEYKEYVDKQKQLYSKYASKKVGGGLIDKMATAFNPTANLGANYQRELNQLQSKYGEAIAANYLLQRKSDEELQEFNNKLKQGIQYQGVAISNQSKILRYTKETNNAASGGSGGKTTKGENTPTYAVGSIGYYEKLISDLQKQIKLQVDSTEIEKLKNQIKEAQTQLDLLLNPQTLNLTKLEGLTGFSTIKLDLEIPTESIVKVYDEANKKIRSILLSNDVGEIGEEQAKELIDGINKELENQGLKPIKVELNTDIYKQAQERINKVLDAYDMGSIGHNQAQQLIDEVNRTLKANKLKPIEVEVRTDTQKMFDNLQYNANSIVDGFEGIDTVISNINSLSEAIENGANAWEIFMNVLQTGVNIIQAVSNVLEMLNTLTKLYGATSAAASQTVAAGTRAEAQASIENASAKATESVASATASGAKLPFPYNLAAIAAGIAAVVSALALMGTFANGGVIGGNSYSGDRLLARVNSGEAILNQNQQKHLFTLLDGNHGTSISGGNVRFIIQGKDLVGTLKNYNNRNSKLI